MNLPEAPELRADLSRALGQIGEAATDDVLEALSVHLRLLARWNPRYGLTRIESWEEILERHVKESLLPLRWIGSQGRLLDIGTGNGFPAIPILCCRPEVCAVLVERSERKALFLDAVVREAGLTGIEVERRDLGPRRSRSRRTMRSRSRRPMSASPPTLVLRGGGLDVGHPKDHHADDQRREDHAGIRKPLLQVGYPEEELFDYVISRATLPAERYLSLASHRVRPRGRVFFYGGEAAWLRVDRRERPDPVREGGLQGGGVTQLRLLAREPIPGRRDSHLFILEASVVI